jgi:thioredoxin-related protein
MNRLHFQRCCSLVRQAIIYCWPAFGALGFLVLEAVPGLAQEVNWRYEYNTARREAEEKNLPMVLDFGTENCFWCKRLDESTFRDASVLTLMNERFIPLKVDASRNAFLTETLHIQSFPTIVLAASDGKILGTFEGYMEANRFQEVLQNALANLSTPDWMARDYQEASRAITSANYARAIALLRHILADDKEAGVQVKARQLLNELEQQAATRLARAKELDGKGQVLEAADTITELLRVYAGTQAAAEGDQLLASLNSRPEVRVQQRARRARELLTQAKEDYRAKQYLCCLDRCEMLANGYGDLSEGAEAVQLLSEIKNNPEWMRLACESLGERLGFLYLSLAETWLSRGQPQQAIYWLERVQQTFPGTRQSEAAQIRLAQLQGQPSRHTEFKRPVPEAPAPKRPSAAKPSS